MAGLCFNCFGRRRSKNYSADQTLVTCEKTFADGIEKITDGIEKITDGIEKINVIHQNVQTTHDEVKAGVHANQVKLELIEKFVDKLSDQLSYFGSIAEKLKELAEMVEKYAEARKKVVPEISGNIRQCRISLDHMKGQLGVNDWKARNKQLTESTEKIATEREGMEKELYMLMCDRNRLSDDDEEIVAHIERLRAIRESYIAAHNRDIDDLKAKADMALKNEMLFASASMETQREILFHFASKVSELEKMHEELVRFRTLRNLREMEIQSLRIEADELNKVNAELMYRVDHNKEELAKLTAKPAGKQLPQEAMKRSSLFNRVKSFVLSKLKR